MEENVMLRIAVQAKGRLNEQSMDLLKEAGVTVSQEKRKFLIKQKIVLNVDINYLKKNQCSKEFIVQDV